MQNFKKWIRFFNRIINEYYNKLNKKNTIMIFTTFWAVFFIILFCLVGLILFLIGYFGDVIKINN